MARIPTLFERLQSIIAQANELQKRLPAFFEREGGDDDSAFDDIAVIDGRLDDVLGYLDHKDDLARIEAS